MVPFPAESRWQYKCPFRKVWVDVTPEEDRHLKEGYARCSQEPAVAYMLNGVRFTTDFTSLLRTNVASKRSMEVRLRDGELPFAPPRPERDGPAPTAASLGQESGIQECVVPANLDDGPQGPVPFQVRKAMGQGVAEGMTMSGKFEFSLEASEKEQLGEMLTWHMLAAGIPPHLLDSRHLRFITKKGHPISNSKEEVARALDNVANYPVKVRYEPPQVFRGVPPESVVHFEVNRIWLKFIKDAVAQLGGDIYNVKHRHQQKTFERYMLYLEDHYYQNDDNLDDATTLYEFLAKYPHMYFTFNLTEKTGPNLARVLRGEVDVLEYLFGM